MEDLISIKEEIINKLEDITQCDYERIVLKDKFTGETIESYISSQNLICAIEDLITTYGGLEEKYEDLKSDLNENYKYIGGEE